MSDQAAQTPAAPSSTPAAPPSRVVADGSFHDFQAQIQERLKAKQQPQGGPSQPPPVAKTVQPKPAESQKFASISEMQDAAAKANAEVLEPGSKTLDQVEVPAQEGQTDEQQQQQTDQPQITPEDLELLAKAKKWLESETMPEEFLKKLVALKNGEEVEYEPFEESLQGRMRQRDHTRQMQAIQRERQEHKEKLGYYEGHFEAIFNDDRDGAAGGDAMYEIFTRAGKFKQLQALHQKMERQIESDVDAANGVGLALMRRLQIDNPRDHRVQEAIHSEWGRRQEERQREAKLRGLEFENQRLKQAQEQTQKTTQNEEFYAAQRNQLAQLRPRAFETMGLNHEDAVHRQEFDTYLHAIIQQENASRVTPELVMKAARAVKEWVKERGQAVAANGGTPQSQQRGFQPQLGGGGGKMPGAAKKEQWHADSFAERFRLPKW